MDDSKTSVIDDISFDRVYDRSQSNSVKWDKYLGRDVLPMWVADMDFKSPPAVIAAITEKANEGIFAYGTAPDELSEVFIQHAYREYEWKVNDSAISFIAGIVPGINMVCRALVASGEAIITATPIYTPFLQVAENNGCELHRIEADFKEGQWHYPLEALAKSLAQNPTIRLLLLCNPFNPIGRALTEYELREIASLCIRYDVTICSDEIHCELIFGNHKHIPIASLSPEIADVTITFMAPTKTCNMAGIGGSIVVIDNANLRSRFTKAKRGMSAGVSSLSYAAMLAAYRDCDEWKKALLDYLESNRDYLSMRVESFSGIHMSVVEATYLAWLDVRELGLNNAIQFFEEAGVGMSPGEQFEGDGYMRLNFACPRKTLIEACDRIERHLPPKGGG